MPEITITEESREVYDSALSHYRDKVDGIHTELIRRFKLRLPSITKLSNTIFALIKGLRTGTGQIEEDMQALVKRAIMSYRLEFQSELESMSELTNSSIVLDELEKRILPINQVAEKIWFTSATAEI